MIQETTDSDSTDYHELCDGNEYATVKIGSSTVETFQINEIDGGLAVHVHPATYDDPTNVASCQTGNMLFVDTGGDVKEIETPLETFQGRVERVQLEHGILTLWIVPTEDR